MIDITKAGYFKLGDKTVARMGYGAMQLAGPGVFGPPKDKNEALSVLKEAVALGVNHIDTSDFYGPHITNDLIMEALHPYPKDLVLVTKVGVRRDEKGGWIPAQRPEDLVQGVYDNLSNLGIDTIDVVNLRIVDGMSGPKEGSIAERFTALAELQQKGRIRHLGLSNVTANQVAEAQKIAPVVCVQNQYNIVHRFDDELIDSLAQQQIAYVPFFPLGGFSQLQSEALEKIASCLGISGKNLALAWLLARSPNILLIPGTSKIAHLKENLAAAEIELSGEVLSELDGIGKKS